MQHHACVVCSVHNCRAATLQDVHTAHPPARAPPRHCVLSLLPQHYSTHGVLGAIVQDAAAPEHFGAAAWDGVQLHSAGMHHSRQDAEALGERLVTELAARRTGGHPELARSGTAAGFVHMLGALVDDTFGLQEQVPLNVHAGGQVCSVLVGAVMLPVAPRYHAH